MEFKLSDNQITQIAKMLYLNLEEIKNYIEMHQVEYNDFLKEEQKENTKDKSFTNNNSVWTFYIEDTICKINIVKEIETEKEEQKDDKSICENTRKEKTR